MSCEAITYQKKGQIGYITLNRPEMANAINTQMAVEIGNVCRQINQEEDIRVVVISGAGGKAFCSGEDLSQFSSAVLGESSSLSELKEFTLRCNVSAMVAGIECPIIAAINGDALGAGLALALSCDLRIASDRSLFGIPDVGRGYLLASGITQWLPRIVGRGKAMELILTAEPINAQEAYRVGLVHRVVQHDEVLSQAEKLANEIASRAPLALRYAKEVVSKGLDLTLEQGLRLECDLYMLLQTTQDRIEGVKAFREKRQPLFKGE
ncbi:MAG TPA: enoyl-CoA hydratase-related protein [Dehalococcoidia bacterium]|nr:enoyl-CoA hydratase-related protein [Dehalococcoidia bacterium]